MFEEGKNSNCLQCFYDGQSGRIQAVELNGFRLIAVTDAASCPRSLVEQVERIAECAYKPQQLLLRAKELAPYDYAKLARKCYPFAKNMASSSLSIPIGKLPSSSASSVCICPCQSSLS